MVGWWRGIQKRAAADKLAEDYCNRFFFIPSGLKFFWIGASLPKPVHLKSLTNLKSLNFVLHTAMITKLDGSSGERYFFPVSWGSHWSWNSTSNYWTTSILNPAKIGHWFSFIYKALSYEQWVFLAMYIVNQSVMKDRSRQFIGYDTAQVLRTVLWEFYRVASFPRF